MSNWLNAPDEEEIMTYHGFVYKITRLNAKDGEKKYYWGKKIFQSHRKQKQKKDEKRAKRKWVESDWKKYYGSSKELLNDIELHGKENFERSILTLCKTKWMMAYEELLVQIQEKVLFRDDSYNGIIHDRIGKVPKDLKDLYMK